ncbi:MAG: sigma-70 family RNA polymerase sigma factor, partial [Bacteroidota bacterium]|nr:sigma-70 family RNA polymerase sigma factor [Bacteroidota bacterium]
MNKQPLPPDDQLLQLIKNDDLRAFERLFKFYHKPLWYFAKEILKDGDEAEDTIQQLFLTIWERRKELVITVSIKSYLYAATRNASLKKIEKSGRTVAFEYEEDSDNQMDYLSAASRIMEKDLSKAIQTAIHQLPERCRLVFSLSRFSEMSYKQIA